MKNNYKNIKEDDNIFLIKMKIKMMKTKIMKLIKK